MVYMTLGGGGGEGADRRVCGEIPEAAGSIPQRRNQGVYRGADVATAAAAEAAAAAAAAVAAAALDDVIAWREQVG
jgi:hypothetical protein